MRSLIYQICLILILKKRNRNVWQNKSSKKKKKVSSETFLQDFLEFMMMKSNKNRGKANQQ
jgi:hypothetical protein